MDITGLEGSIEVAEAGKEGLDFGECPSRPLPKQTIMQTKLRKNRAYDPTIKRRENKTEIPTCHWPE
jgi:hypothetical protein